MPSVNRSLLESIKSRKLKYYGHVLRNKEEILEKDIIQGTVPGRRARGRPRMVWMDNIKVWTGLSLTETLRSVENKKKWRRVVNFVFLAPSFGIETRFDMICVVL